MIKYLSPSSIKTYQEDRNKFYLKYLSPNPPPRDPQTGPMSVGSAFDAYVKSYMVEELLGGLEGFGLEELLVAQVAPELLDEARINGAECFALYQKSGALADLMLEVRGCEGEPRFETRTEGSPFGIPLLGYPDLYYISDGVPVVLDWKVNGFYSRASPHKGYLKCRGVDGVVKIHKDAEPAWLGRVEYSSTCELRADWKLQTCIYSWLLGCPVGSRFVVGIEQLVGPRAARAASHRMIMEEDYQYQLRDTIIEIWESCKDTSWQEELEEKKDILWMMS